LPNCFNCKAWTKVIEPNIIVLSVPAQSIRESLKDISFADKRKIIVNTAKGIEKSTHLLPYQIVQSIFGNSIEYYTLIGPSFAKEVVHKMPTLVNLGYVKEGPGNVKIRNLFQTNYFRVKLAAGVEALELSAAFKNIYAIACGLADGLGYGTNTRVKMIVLAIDEMNDLYKKINWRIDPKITAGTIGDLILTCNSAESRNFTFGSLLAKNSVRDSLTKIHSTVEGLSSLSSVGFFEKKASVKLSLADFVSSIVRMDNPKMARRKFKSFVKLV
jgi:glycerol-3-phosphate dehydrogenase (NAD(P)+)